MKLSKLQKRTIPNVGIEPTTLESSAQSNTLITTMTAPPRIANTLYIIKTLPIANTLYIGKTLPIANTLYIVKTLPIANTLYIVKTLPIANTLYIAKNTAHCRYVVHC